MYYSDEVDNDIANDESGQLGAFYGLGAGTFPGVVDHIPAQNQAGNDLAAVVSQWAAAKGNGSANVAQGSALANRARLIGATFASFARSLKNARADRGASEIEALANNIGAGIDSDVGKLPPAQSTLIPPQQTVISQPDIITSTVPAITRTVDRIIGDVVGAVTGSGGSSNGPTDYGLPAATAGGFGLPDWLLPVAAGIGLVMFLRR